MKVAQISALTFAIQSFVTLFVIMDPPGATPIFLALVAHKLPHERRILAIKAASVSFFVITLFALFGRFILSYLNVSMAALQAAGALLLLLISLDLLTGGKGVARVRMEMQILHWFLSEHLCWLDQEQLLQR